MVIIQNLSLLIKPEVLSNMKIYNTFDANVKTQLSYVIFEKLQNANKEMARKITEPLENLLQFYVKLRYDLEYENSLIDAKTSSLNNLKVNFTKMKSFKTIDDTGLIIIKIIEDCVVEEEIQKFINTNVGYIY